MYVLSREEMTAIDSHTINEFGLAAAILMEYAGYGSALFIADLLPAGGEPAIFCGHGNNGGDGFVIARCLKNLGFSPHVFFIGDPVKMSSETKGNYELLFRMKIPLYPIPDPETWQELAEEYFDNTEPFFDGVIDAMFGIGFSGELPPLHKEIIEKLNNYDAPKFAIDIPSGIDAATGWCNDPFHADYTLTMAAPKYGHYLGRGKEFCGAVIPIDIGIPSHVWQEKRPGAALVNEANAIFPYRNNAYHKGHYGRVAIIAGSPGYSGAAIMAARAALHSGSGLITLFHHQGMETIYETSLTEIMTRPLPFKDHDPRLEETMLADDIASIPEYAEFLETLDLFDVLLIGPGSGVSPLTTALVNLITSGWNKPALLDADALNILAHYPDWLKRIEGKPFILTPHVGEFARMLQISPAEVLQDTPAVLDQFLTLYDINLLLKAATRIYRDRSRMLFDISGNDGLATGGSGDVLSGIIISFLGQGLPPHEAATAGSYLLGTTAETCNLFKDTPAITPTDIIENLFLEEE